MIARIAVLAPVDQAYDYAVPETLVAQVSVGSRVWVPWGPRTVEGVVCAIDPPDARSDGVKPIRRIVDAPPLLPELARLSSWIAEHYVSPPGEVMRLFLPVGGKARATQFVRLSEEGERAAQAIGAALEPHSLAQLDVHARNVLGAIAKGARSVRAIERDHPGADAVVRRLAQLGLVRVEERVSTRGAKVDQQLRAVAVLDDAQRAKSPKRAQVLDAIRAAPDVTLAMLARGDAKVRTQVAALVKLGLVTSQRVEISTDPFDTPAPLRDSAPTLTAEQAHAVERIEGALEGRKYSPFLLHGVTGSGKTEVYLHVIATNIARGRSALVLVPEISLTPQLAHRFRARFGDRVAVLHSGLTQAARAEAWRRIERGQVEIALGARSAVFAPLPNLGVVVVDEEHDPSFKQEEGVRYHGRDVALMRAKDAGAVAILGSATPALETYYASQSGRIARIELTERATGQEMPRVEVIDLRVEKPHPEGLITASLDRAIDETLARGEQVILFLNRRGFATFMLCTGCGSPLKCRDCAVGLTYHRGSGQLRCHYCGYSGALPKLCPGCGAAKLEQLGQGTERVESYLKERFPRARIARLDRDTSDGGRMEATLEGLRERRIDLLIGTQMVTKGHDFPGVTLVGVLLADQGMGLPDFRASERAFQLVEQVAGRAGRAGTKGRVLVQTFQPQHAAIVAARGHDYVGFYNAELETRRDAEYPPFCRLVVFRVDGAELSQVVEAAKSVAQTLIESAARAPDDAHVLVRGPMEAPLARLKGRSRWQVMIKTTQVRAARALARAAGRAKLPAKVRLTVDVDPMSML